MRKQDGEARDLLPLWMAERTALLRKIEYRERELLELHEDYISLQRDCNVLRRLWRYACARGMKPAPKDSE